MPAQAVPLEIRQAAAREEDSTSLAKILANLRVGASHTITRKIPLSEATHASITENADQAHNIGRSHMARAKAATHGLQTYTGEISYGLSSPRAGFDVLVHFIITRTA